MRQILVPPVVLDLEVTALNVGCKDNTQYLASLHNACLVAKVKEEIPQRRRMLEGYYREKN